MPVFVEAPLTYSRQGYVIINSIIWLHMQFESLWHGINNALPLVDGDVGTFVQALSPIVDDIEEQQAEKLQL